MKFPFRLISQSAPIPMAHLGLRREHAGLEELEVGRRGERLEGAQPRLRELARVRHEVREVFAHRTIQS